jgi:hypothetical protein
MPDGIVHLVRRLAEHRGEPADSGGDWPVREPALAPLLPLIHYCVPDSALPLSAATRERCAQAYYHTAARNLLIYQELSRILAALSGEQQTGRPGEGETRACPEQSEGSKTDPPFVPLSPGLLVSSSPLHPRTPAPLHLCTPAQFPVIVLKSAALATTLYPSIGLRPMGDIDLLVPQNCLAEAVACLQALGYVEPAPDMAPGLNQVVGHHVSLDGGEAIPLHVELHWTLAAGEHARHAPSMPWFWQQTEPLSMGAGGLGSGGAREPRSTGAEELGSRGARERRSWGEEEQGSSAPQHLSLPAPLHLGTSALLHPRSSAPRHLRSPAHPHAHRPLALPGCALDASARQRPGLAPLVLRP